MFIPGPILPEGNRMHGWSGINRDEKGERA